MRLIGRLADRFVSRGEGLDARGDPFGPPLSEADAARLLDAVREARFASDMRAPLPLPDAGADMDLALRPPAGGGAWCVFAPPYGGFGRPGELGLYELHARALERAGFGVAAFAPPYHGARAMRGKPSGWGFVRADLAHTARAVAASAAEATALARWLREERGAARVVGWGLSLGGAAVGLAAVMGAPFDRLAFLAAVDNPAAFYETGQNRAARRRTLRAAGYGPAEVEAAFRVVAPSTHAPPKAPALFAIPPEDLVVPAAAQEKWRASWNGERMDLGWRGHAIGLSDPLVATRIAKWLAREPR